MAEELPGQCNYLALGAARISEIKAIVSKLGNCEHGKRALQNLPRHMQRRAMSSNPKRLPRSLREKHMREGGDNVKPKHRPRRKYRRRPSNLLAEYNRRQKDFVWLETHIWHAKRFHMKRQWGYVLPNSPTFKGYRAMLRAAKKSCLLQDVSFLCCIELEGPKATLLDGFSRMLLPAGLTSLSDTHTQQGKKWTTVMLFNPDRHPYGAIGEVDVLWHPSPCSTAGEQQKASTLWLWVHPSTHSQVVDALSEVFQLVKSSSSKVEIVQRQESIEDIKDCENKQPIQTADIEMQGILPSEENEKEDNNKSCQQKESKKVKKQKNCVNEAKVALKNIPFERTPEYTSNNGSIIMRLLKDTLNRFQLTGPQAYSVMSAAFHPATVNVQDESMKNIEDESGSSEQPWWRKFYSISGNEITHKNQVRAWEGLASQSEPTPRAVLPLVVRDPRATLPHKKIPLEITSGTVQEPLLWPVESAIYNSGLRDMITQSKEPDADVNKRRVKFLVPGSKLPETPDESRLPLLFLAMSPSYSAEYGSGWDIVVPGGWGMSVWMSLVYCGGVAGGQQEVENLHMEMHTPLPPHLLPDTPAGGYYSEWLASKRHTHYFKRPPAARHNFIKLGIQFPFSHPWRKLVQDWVPGAQDVYALRDNSLLTELAQVVEDTQTCVEGAQKRKANYMNGSPRKKKKVGGQKTDTSLNTSVEQSDSSLTDICNIEKRLQGISFGCLVMVKLELCHKGSLEPCAVVCLPQEEDLQARKMSVKPSDKFDSISEPPHPDTKAEYRTKMKEAHHKIKCRMQRQRRKARQKVSLNTDIVSAARKEQTFEQAKAEALERVQKENQVILDKYSSFNEEMENAWLMNTSDPLQSCSRKILGYITHGTFSQTLGKGAGIGWVSLKPLLSLVHLCQKVNVSPEEQNDPLIDGDPRRRTGNGCLVLVRNTSSLTYRWAKLSVLTKYYKGS